MSECRVRSTQVKWTAFTRARKFEIRVPVVVCRLIYPDVICHASKCSVNAHRDMATAQTALDNSGNADHQPRAPTSPTQTGRTQDSGIRTRTCRHDHRQRTYDAPIHRQHPKTAWSLLSPRQFLGCCRHCLTCLVILVDKMKTFC